MHRMPLFLSSPSKLWNRTNPEYSLFQMALNQGNVREMHEFVDILDTECQRQYMHEFKYGTSQVDALEEVIEDNGFLHNKDAFEEVMNMLRTIILRAPRENLALQTAFFIRGRIFFLKFSLKAAINDLTFYLHLRDSDSDDKKSLAIVHGILAICYYFVREDSKAIMHLKIYKPLRAKVSTELQLDADFALIERQISHFEDELRKPKQPPNFTDKVNPKYPFEGFNSSSDIPLASSACFYASFGDIKDPSRDMSPHFGVFAKIAIPEESTVLMEDPFVSELATPFIQCEICFSYRFEVYSCLECRYKTYCSLDCMTADSMHSDECSALKDLMLLILDARSLFNVFVRLSGVLKERVFKQRSFRTEMDYIRVFNGIEHFNDSNPKSVKAQSVYINFMKKMPQYDKLSDMQYSTLVATALRLTVYIERKTEFIPKYYGSLKLSDKQNLMLIGAILMRIQGHLLLNTFDFDLKLPLVGAEGSSEENLRKLRPYDGVVSDLNKFYNVNESKELKKYQKKIVEKAKNVPSSKLPEVQHIKPCQQISRIMSSYKDHIAELYFTPDKVNFILYGETSGLPSGKAYAKELCNRINDMGEAERLTFVQTFVCLFHTHLSDFFINHRKCHNLKRQTLCIYSETLAKFEHSCDPNITIVVLDNGSLMGKTIRNIDRHEELTVSHKANYTIHSRAERKQFLENIGSWCRCRKCVEPIGLEVTEVRSGLYCKCGHDSEFITPNRAQCSFCYTSYNALLDNYKQEIFKFDEQIKAIESKSSNGGKTQKLYDADERELYMLYKLRYEHARRSFATGHEFRIKGFLMYAKFLARKNFSQIAYNVILELKDGLMQFNDAVWFTYFEELMKIIIKVLAVNFDEGCTAISNTSLLNLCHVGWDITQGQKKHALLHDTWDSKCVSIEDNRRRLRLWKEKIVQRNMVSVSDSFLARDANKDPNENIPRLSKPY